MKTILTTIFLAISLTSFSKQWPISISYSTYGLVDTSGNGSGQWYNTVTWDVEVGDTIILMNYTAGETGFRLDRSSGGSEIFVMTMGGGTYTYYVIGIDVPQLFVRDAGLIVTYFTLNVSPSTTTGVEAPAVASMQIYPNPVIDILNIEAKAGAVVSIYSVGGELIDTQTLTNGFKMDLTWLDRGLYLLWVDDLSYKLLKQ